VGQEKYSQDVKAVLDSLLLSLPGVSLGKMFGFPAYYVNKKMFACIYGDGVGVKVPWPLAQKLLAQPGIIPFRPLGRPPMREWVQINRPQTADYRQDLEILQAAIAYVSTLDDK
jgi:hypothetical protein